MYNHPPGGGKNTNKMKAIKLKVGKTYRNRRGERVKIVRKDNTRKYHYRGSNDEWYTESGKWNTFHKEHPEDLIEEAPSETRHTFALVAEALTATRYTFDIPEGVKRVTTSQEGNRIVVEMVPEEGPKPGDVLRNDMGSVYIFKAVVDSDTHKQYALLGENGRLVIGAACASGRPATAEEAQPLWDALKKDGKRWNAETMQVEEIAEKEKIEKFLEGYANGVRWSHEQLRQLIEGYLIHREGEK